MSVNFDASKGTIPAYIQESWKRCHSKGLELTTMDKKSSLGEYELAEYYDQYAELLYYSSPILKDVYDSIHGTDSILLLAAPEGYIIDAVGDPSFIRKAENVALRKGANWLEESKGTNAIGTAIVEKKPVLVHGSQHFYQDNHFLTCAATPIFHPDGRLLGVLNLSSHQQNYHPFSLSLVQRVAHSIKQSLLLADTQKQTKDLYFIYDQHPNSLITLNKEGNITSLNFAASRTIGCSEQNAVGQPIGSIISGLDSSALLKGQDQNFSLNNQLFTVHTVASDNQDHSRVILRVEKQQQKGLISRYQFTDIINNDSHLNETISIAKRAADLDISLLITGESGTGKELFAQSIHGASLRSDKPFIAINCSAIPESLLESELFGYEKGAFTGAKSGGQTGKFEAANGGTLFLDEIGDMPLTAQATLLRVLQERCVTRIGGITPRPIDVRIIAATNKDLQKEIEAGQFRADLFFRLNGFTLKLPALRNRTDMLLLAEHILSQLPFKKEKAELTEDAKTFIVEYDWPGNFREMQNILQQAAFLADHNPITKALLVSLCPTSTKRKNEETTEQKPTSLLEQEIHLIKQTLERTNGNISYAAKQLNIGRNTLYRKMKMYNITL
ncbi:sigma-54-dependent Fis family transcriptional regulator [Peribacillus cavernae]|uniref:Sigma-54-dependent Fis family transcriptional regulator n=1 Tax=Peribacillus cavernae TaxID=1674310 RepID=A0A3S1B203_9BACI|nr:sigma-54-dependent Fis family transcriptional regulator [Peribacillus cavernae]MDQ0219915.1 transcriptional regulator of acetoin/glycerol metabolism [Peribacillus cavernae]RUQ26603.1 sigma-54-dependent Fis family transcriptional regulator [Peribacillus cavernae]